MRSFALIICLLATVNVDGSSSSSSSSSTTTAAVTTSTSTAAVTTTSTVASTPTTTSTVAATTTSTAATSSSSGVTASSGVPVPVFDFKEVNSECTKVAVESALTVNSTACANFTGLLMGGNPAAFCDATTACASKAAAAFVAKKCPLKYTMYANLVCAKDGTTFLFTDVQKTISETQSTVLSSTSAPSYTCTAKYDFARQWVLSDVATSSPHKAIFEAICQGNCWSSFYGYLRSSPSPKELATAVTSTDKCTVSSGCSIQAAGLYAKYYPTSNPEQVALFRAIDEYSKGACVNSKAANGVCGAQASLNTNLVAVASTFSLNANSFYVGTYNPVVTTTPVPSSPVQTTTPAAGQAAATTTTTTQASATTSTTTRAATTTTTTTQAATTTTTTTQAATTSTTTTQAPTTTTTSVNARRRLQTNTTATSNTTSTSNTTRTNTTSTSAAAPYPWVAVLNGVTDKTTACNAIIEYNKIGCCGLFVGRVSALLGAASDSKLATPSRTLNTAYPNAEILCPAVSFDPTCQEGTAPTGKDEVKSVTVEFTLNGVSCSTMTDAVLASMGEGMAMTFVELKYAPNIESADVAICDKSFRAAKAALAFSRRRLQSAKAAFTAKGTADQIAKLTDTSSSDTSKGTTALASLNSAISSAVQAGVSKAIAEVPPSEFAKAGIDLSKVSAEPVTAAAVKPPVTVPPKSATTNPATTTTATVSGAPAAMSAMLAPVCAVAAMFAASS